MGIVFLDDIIFFGTHFIQNKKMSDSEMEYEKEIASPNSDDESLLKPTTKHSQFVDVDESFDPFANQKSNYIAERESEYHRKGRANRVLSPERVDPFSADKSGVSYKEVLQKHQARRQEHQDKLDAEKKRIQDEQGIKSLIFKNNRLLIVKNNKRKQLDEQRNW